MSTFDNPEMVKLGRCDVIEQIQIGDETLLKFSGVPLGEACSIVLRGATEQIIGEAERSLHDALCVLTSTVKETKTVYGGGNLTTVNVRNPNVWISAFWKIVRMPNGSVIGH